ncbi:MAG: GNAT family N-acetyltransferase [Pseudomonadota bacterium]
MIALSDTPTLRTERLVLRAPLGSDWPHWRAFHTDMRAQWIGGAKGADGAWRAFGHVIGHWAMRGFGSFVFHRQGDPTPIGMCGPWFPEGWPETEIGWTLWSGAHEGKGFATEAARTTMAFARDRLGWHSAVSYIHPDNAASMAVAVRLGATRDETAARPHANDVVYRHWGMP